MRRRLPSRTYVVAAALAVVGLVWWGCCLPSVLFEVPYARVVRAADGTLLSARIAADGQWRLPGRDTLDARYRTAVQLFEDEYFGWHPGVNPVAILRALRQNWRSGRTVSGGSTLTMQTVRLIRGSPARTLREKLVEVLWATRLEARLSKPEILQLYADHAPFGGNVVGIEAAAWRYYGRDAGHFSWAEAATLAVLPNAPGLLYPGRSTRALRAKRDRLLDKLHDRGHLNADQLVLAKAEPLPGEPYRLPDLAPHATSLTGATTRLALDARLQARCSAAVGRQYERTRGNGVHNAAALVLDVATGEAIAYVGNTHCRAPNCGSEVDVIRARRSSGSTLKPFLYASLLDRGDISPATLLADIPTSIAGYAPKNFDLAYDGAVPAGEALTRSLNVPHVRQLQAFGIDPFLQQLRRAGLATLDRAADHYGLSLILGGGEVTLWDLAHAYRGLARSAQGVHDGEWSASAAYLTLNTLTELTRPGDLATWRSFSGARRVAWKTGTSFGHRDAWAVGVTPEYVVAVWTGNATGEGRRGLTGASVAAPLLFEVFDELPGTTWFEEPVHEMAEVFLCRASGLQAGTACPAVDTTLLTARGQRLRTCGYHARVLVDASGLRVDASCARLHEAAPYVAFELPPAWAWYYRERHPEYAGAPAWAPTCGGADDEPMALLYPRRSAALSLPRGLDGERQAVAFEVAHQRPGERLHWYLDGALVGTTARLHQLPLRPPPGAHELIVVDGAGARLRYAFRVVSG